MSVMSHGTACRGCNPDGPPDQPRSSGDWLRTKHRPRPLVCAACGQTGHSDPWCERKETK